MPSRITRRGVLKSTGASIIPLSLAGCTGNGSNGNGSNGDTNGDTGAESISISYASHAPGEPHYIAKGLNSPYFSQLEQESDGQVEVETHYGGAMGGLQEVFDLVHDGAVDMCIQLTHLTPRYDRNFAANFPVEASPCEVALTRLALRREGETLRQDFEENNTIPGPLQVVAPNQILTTEDVGRIESTEDLEGLNLRSASPIASGMLAEYNATGTEMDPADVYTALERGTVDGVMTLGTTWEGWEWYEMAPYATTNLDVAGLMMIEILWNKNSFESLPEDVQELHWRLTDEISMESTQWLQDREKNIFSDLEAEGLANPYDVPEDTAADINQTAIEVAQDYASDNDLDHVYNEYREYAEGLNVNGCPKNAEEIRELID